MKKIYITPAAKAIELFADENMLLTISNSVPDGGDENQFSNHRKKVNFDEEEDF